MTTRPATDLDESTVFRSLFAAYPDALVLVDKQGTIVLANPEAGSLLGHPMHEPGTSPR